MAEFCVETKLYTRKLPSSYSAEGGIISGQERGTGRDLGNPSFMSMSPITP